MAKKKNNLYAKVEHESRSNLKKPVFPKIQQELNGAV